MKNCVQIFLSLILLADQSEHFLLIIIVMIKEPMFCRYYYQYYCSEILR